jgi:hypothetical protein
LRYVADTLHGLGVAESSPERGVSLAESSHVVEEPAETPEPPAPASSPVSSISEETSKPPPADDLYNLTQLAEVR